MATGKCQKKDYDDRNEENEKKPQKRKRATKGRRRLRVCPGPYWDSFAFMDFEGEQKENKRVRRGKNTESRGRRNI